MRKNNLTLYIIVISIMMAALLFMGASCSSTTANVDNAVMTTGIDDNSGPIDKVTEFSVNTDIFVAAELHNAPDDTNITFIWYFEDQIVDEVTITNGDVSDAPLWGNLPGNLVSQPGNYAVGIYIDDRDEPDTLNEFFVKE